MSDVIDDRETCIGDVTVPVKDVDVNDKADSGMDEDSMPDGIHDQDGEDSVQEEEDDEQVVTPKPKKRVSRILDDDSEESQDIPDSGGTKEPILTKSAKKTAEEVLDAVLNATSDDDNSDSSNDSDDNETLLDSLKKKKGTTKEFSDLFDAEESSDDEGQSSAGNNTESVKPLKSAGDLFDAEESNDEEQNKGVEDTGQQDDGDGEDEGFDESSIPAHLLAKLKKGAAKKPKKRTKQQVKKDEMLQLHSETQRIVRESHVSLPYHQPAPRPLTDFLARANKKQQEYRALRGARDFTKAQVLQNILEKNKLPERKATEDGDLSGSDTEWTPGCENDVQSDDEGQKKEEESAVGDTCKQKSCDTNVTSEPGINVNDDDDDDADSLPDIDESQLQKLNSKPHVVNPNSQTQCVTPKLDTQLDSAQISGNSEDTTSNKVTSECENMRQHSSCVEEKEKNESDGVIVLDNERETEKTDNFVCQKGRTEASPVKSSSVSNQETFSQVDQFCNSVNNISNLLSENSAAQNCNTDSSQIDLEKDIPLDSKSPKSNPKLSALAAMGVDIVMPKLSGGAGESFINLGNEEEVIPRNPGVSKLMDRFFKHSLKKEKKHAKETNISIIEKENTDSDKAELKLNTFTYKPAEEDDNPLLKLEAPGAKLVALKEQLKMGMKARREEARQKRQEVFDMDNEEGFEGEKEAEEEEMEMSDHSDTDVEDDEFEEQFGAEEEEEEKERNPFADDEAEEDDDDNNEDEDDDIDNEEDMKLQLDVSDEEAEDLAKESEDDEPVKKPLSSLKKKPRALQISDDEESKDTTDHVSDFKEPQEKPSERHFNLGGPAPLTREDSASSDHSTQFQSGQRHFNVSLPIEDSQDLYSNSMPPLPHTQSEDIHVQPSQSFNFFLEDSQSLISDTDGFMKPRSSVKKPAGLPVDDISNSQDNMGELLGMCTGKFVDTQDEEKEKSSRKNLFDDGPPAGTQGNMDELLGLCSGVFADSQKPESQEKKGTKRKVEEDEESNVSFKLMSDSEHMDSDKEVLSDDEKEKEEDNDTDEVHEDNDEEEQQRKMTFKGFTVGHKHGKIRNEFVEAEAELSGSEYDSDENLDLAVEDDIMEEEEGDKDALGLNEDDLRNQVGRVHLKQMIDEDKRELMRFQEMYLPDGDLHSEGAGRMRRFRWSNLDDDTQQDMFANDSDGEQADDEQDTEYMWRKQRFEREQFLKEQQEKEQNDEENSQFLKLGKVFLKKKDSVERQNSIPEKSSSNPPSSTGSTQGTAAPAPFYKLSSQKRGSFLTRSKEALAKIAEMTKPATNPSAGAKSGGKFVFQVISPEKDGNIQAQNSSKPTLKKATNISTKKPAAKRQKIERENSFSQNSIFNHI